MFAMGERYILPHIAAIWNNLSLPVYRRQVCGNLKQFIYYIIIVQC